MHGLGVEVQPAKGVDDSILPPDALLAVLRYTGDQHIFWSDLALVLGFSETEAEYIRSDNCRTQDQKRDFFKRWLDKGNASWAILVSALRHPQVQGGGFIARKIVEDHPKDGCIVQSQSQHEDMPRIMEEQMNFHFARTKRTCRVGKICWIICAFCLLGTLMVMINLKKVSPESFTDPPQKHNCVNNKTTEGYTESVELPQKHNIIYKKITGGCPETVELPELGFLMNIFPKCFPVGKQVHLSVSFNYHHDSGLNIPKGYKLVSPVYAITASETLQKDVTVTMKHNAVVSKQEMTGSFAILHYSNEGNIEVLQGRTEINSHLIKFGMSELSCYVAVIAMDNVPQSYYLRFYRQRPPDEKVNPALWIQAIFYPFHDQIKEIEEELKINYWIANDDPIHEDITGDNNTLYLRVKPFGCWVTHKENTEEKKTLSLQPVRFRFLMVWKTSNCNFYQSFVKFSGSHDVTAFVNDVVLPPKDGDPVTAVNTNSMELKKRTSNYTK